MAFNRFGLREESWPSSDAYLVYVIRQDGQVVAFSDELVAVYDSVDNIGNDPIAEIMLV